MSVSVEIFTERLNKDTNPYIRLLKAMKKERLLLKVLNKIGISSSDSIELLSHPMLSSQKGGSENSDDVYDVRDDSEKEDLVIWWNDIETDERYSDWPDNLFEVDNYQSTLRAYSKLMKVD